MNSLIGDEEKERAMETARLLADYADDICRELCLARELIKALQAAIGRIEAEGKPLRPAHIEGRAALARPESASGGRPESASGGRLEKDRAALDAQQDHAPVAGGRGATASGYPVSSEVRYRGLRGLAADAVEEIRRPKSVVRGRRSVVKGRKGGRDGGEDCSCFAAKRCFAE